MIVWVALPVANGWAGACPNEALRSELRSGQLPDCRAYEMVSPTYTESQSATLGEVFAISREGTRVVLGSLGTFGGAEQGALNNTLIRAEAYLLERTSAGWASVSLGAPSSQYRGGGGLLDASTDLDASLWALGTLAQQEEVFDLFLERPVGTFVEIGPLIPGGGTSEGGHNYRYLGASGDLSRVLFSTEPESRWPFDDTASGGTLYEYIGAGQSGELREPDLVGVEGGRGSRALISQCGTRLGSSSTERRPSRLGSTYNAISAGGGRVFFTATGADHDACGFRQPPADELFVREEVAPSAGAGSPEMRTLAISCPSAPLSPCADANFEGASQDGARVFFTSTEKLVAGASEDNTGGDTAQECSNTKGAGGCNLYADELVGSGASVTQRLTLVSAGSSDPEVQGVARISEDGSHVYFVAKGRLTETPNGLGRTAITGEDNLYMYADGHVSFVATLSPGDATDWMHEDERPVMASGEGRYLVFLSVADLTDEGVGGGKHQVFQYDAATGALVRASIGQDGYNNDGRKPAVGSAVKNGTPDSYRYASTNSPTLANASSAPANGAVFFESPDALTPQALSDQHDSFGRFVPNIYEYRAGHVYLLSDGHDVSFINGLSSVYLVGSDPSGSDVFFFTSDSLISSDGNTQQDLYDSRVAGGFPVPPLPADCKEACQGALAGAPALAPPGGSATQTAEAGVPPATSVPATVKPKAKSKLPRRSKPTRKRKIRAGRKARRAALLGKRAHRSSPRSMR
jgi:hypothetical protein